MSQLMKILLLNPHIDAQHKIARALKARGYALLMPSNSDEAWHVLKLHGSSVDLAIIHREGISAGDPGVELLYKVKKDPSEVDLPIIFTTELWNQDQCASHQQTPMGVNAYLRWPFDESALLKTIDAMFGTESSAEVPPSAPESGTRVSLEILERPKIDSPSLSQFTLEAPVIPESETSVPVPEQLGISLPEISLTAPEILKTSAPPDLTPVTPVADATRVSPAKGEMPNEALEIELAETQVKDLQAAQEMPYLFSKGDLSKSLVLDPAAFARAFAQPVGDAVVPGGAAHTPDIDTLKKYLLLREQDVATLSNQLKISGEELYTIKAQLAAEQSRANELQFTVSDQARKIEDFEREKTLALEGLQTELKELRFQNKAKTDKAKLLEIQVREATTEIERLKERVRADIRKIRVRERELENKLEIAKKDSEAILAARENKIIELKRKLDLLEFNMDLLQDRYAREREGSAKLREKLAKAAQVVRVAEGLLDEPGSTLEGTEETKAS